MLGEGSHQDDDALPHRVVVGRVGRGRQEVLKHGQQDVDVVLKQQHVMWPTSTSLISSLFL